MRHFDRAAENLKRMLLKMIDVVDMSVSGAVTSFSRRDVTKAEEVLKSDDVIDAMEVDIEEECLKILALHQPSAASLRFIVATLKINNDLERIGDLACSMARRARAYSQFPELESTYHFQDIARRVQIMVRQSLETLVNFDIRLARVVIDADGEVDRLHRLMYDEVKAAVRSSPDRVDQLFLLLSVSRNLERIADHATNIARDVIYMLEGAGSQQS